MALPRRVAAMPSDVRKAFGLPAKYAIWILGYAHSWGAAPVSLLNLDGSAQGFRTSVGIAERLWHGTRK
ncbi:MAG TPA: hypothetical protein DC054_14775 [Blastocatellia bacterium]|nr:hypothetical protein [Blastocatellia bacterium]